jgi:hypothetical protein
MIGQVLTASRAMTVARKKIQARKLLNNVFTWYLIPLFIFSFDSTLWHLYVHQCQLFLII